MGGKRTKKRRFQGNQWSDVDRQPPQAGPVDLPTQDTPRERTSASFAKLGNTEPPNKTSRETIVGNRIINVLLLKSFVLKFPCPECYEKLSEEVTEEVFGLASILEFKCGNPKCGILQKFVTSAVTGSGAYEINLRTVIATCSTGSHQSDAEKMCGYYDLPPPIKSTAWSSHVGKYHAALRQVADASMIKAARDAAANSNENDAASTDENGIANITVSCDGSWQKRGFTSKNGVATVLTVQGKASKVVDIETMSTYCNTCTHQKAKLGKEEFGAWFKMHKPQCSVNHDGKAGAMEPNGMLRIFNRSVSTARKVRYTGYLGDGDSKAYTTVANADLNGYEHHSITKLECCGHVQKRMGRRLMDKVKALKDKIFVDDKGKRVKGIGGMGKLTQKAIISIQGHYGAAIRNNSGNVPAMKEAIWAIWHHRNGEHEKCGEWCPSKTKKGDPNKHRLPCYIMDAIKDIFKLLSTDELLNKCKHGGTQNTNESIHNMIWKRCPKEVFVGRQRLEVAVWDAVISFNDGEQPKVKVCSILGFGVGLYTSNLLRQLDHNRVQNAERYVAKKRKKSISTPHNGNTNDADDSDEDQDYRAGAF